MPTTSSRNQAKILDNQAGIIAYQEHHIPANQERIISHQGKILGK